MDASDAYAIPTWVGDIELTEPITNVNVPVDPDVTYRQLRLMVRLDRSPVGYVTFEVGADHKVNSQDIVSGVWMSLRSDIEAAAAELAIDVSAGLSVEGLSYERPVSSVDLPMVTVVLCTRNRPEGARSTVADLLALRYTNFEVVVVDNAPSDDATETVIRHEFSDDRLRYIREPSPGLSFARNRGIAEARGSIIAFTDDDVKVDKWWLDGVVQGFGRFDNVGCVTGPVFSARLDNAMQHYFDRRTTWSSLVKPRVFDLETNRDDSLLYPFSPGIFGTGANFAFDAATLRSSQGFDTALGAGSPTGGGEDLDAFLKVLFAGKRIVQEPSAIVWHVHRSSVDQLSSQMFFYGVGLAAFIWKYLINPRTTLLVLRRIPQGLQKLAHMSQRSAHDTGSKTLPRSVLFKELLGVLYGPIAYTQGRNRARRVLQQSVRPAPEAAK